MNSFYLLKVLEKSDGSPEDDYGISVVANAYGLLQKHGFQDNRIDHCVLTHVRAHIPQHVFLNLNSKREV